MTLENEKELSHVATQAHPEQVVRKLRKADRLLGEGMELPEVFKQLEVSEQTYCRWRSPFGGMNAEDLKRLKVFCSDCEGVPRTRRCERCGTEDVTYDRGLCPLCGLRGRLAGLVAGADPRTALALGPFYRGG